MKKFLLFLAFSSVAFLVALCLALGFGWSFWAILIILEIAYGTYLLRLANPKIAWTVGAVVVIALLSSSTYLLFKRNLPLTYTSLPWAKNQADVWWTKTMDPGLSKARRELLIELRKKEDALADNIPGLMQSGKYEDVKKQTQELIYLRKEIETLLAQTNPPPPPTTSTTPAAPSTSGRTFTIALKPKEKYEVDKVGQGQQWSFPAFTGQFQSRVDTGDDSACWETVENTLPWKAEKSGTLQIRTGQADVKVTVNVQS